MPHFKLLAPSLFVAATCSAIVFAQGLGSEPNLLERLAASADQNNDQTNSIGQFTLTEDDSIFLPYEGDNSLEPGDTVVTFGSESEARDVARRISNVVGLEPNFDVLASNVGNAAAVIRNNRRLILYSPSFIERLNGIGAGDWAALSVMAHEIGHHLQGHTVTGRGSNHRVELQADQFSGFAVNRLGGSLADAQAAMANIASNGGSPTHPPKSARLEAIATGWRLASQQSGGGTSPTGRTQQPTGGSSLICSFQSGPLAGKVIDFSGVPNATAGPVGSPCTDGRDSSGIIVPLGTPAETWRNSGQSRQMSTVCEFRIGRLAGTRRDYAGQFPPVPVGTPCQDGAGSSGVVVPN